MWTENLAPIQKLNGSWLFHFSNKSYRGKRTLQKSFWGNNFPFCKKRGFNKMFAMKNFLSFSNHAKWSWTSHEKKSLTWKGSEKLNNGIPLYISHSVWRQSLFRYVYPIWWEISRVLHVLYLLNLWPRCWLLEIVKNFFLSLARCCPNTYMLSANQNVHALKRQMGIVKVTTKINSRRIYIQQPINVFD